jgi:prepilin-type N-terminal cleavage/methylation domain-containing protein
MRKKNGFTLIELLVVISIIALLIAILMPALNKARQQAKFAVCSSNQHQILIALGIYMSDNDGKLPPSASRLNKGNYHRPTELNWHVDTNYNPVGGLIKLKSYTGKYLGESLPTVEVFNCPMSPIAPDTVWPPPDSGMAPEGKYNEFYLNGQYAPLHSTYMLLWSYQGYNLKEHIDPISGEPHAFRENFEGPKNMASKSRLVIQDSLFYLGNNVNLLWPNITFSFYSSHPFDGARKAVPYYSKYAPEAHELPIDDIFDRALLPDVWLNAGYTDGHVERFNSYDTINTQQFSAMAWLNKNIR